MTWQVVCSICGGTDGISPGFKQPEMYGGGVFVTVCGECTRKKNDIPRYTDEQIAAVRKTLAEIEKEKTFKARVAKLLKKCEGAGALGFKEASCCPSCGAPMGCEGDRHAPDCDLSAMLKECGS